MNPLTGQADPRSQIGQFARGKNMYPGGNAPHTTNGPQSFAAEQGNVSSPVGEEDAFRAAILRRLVNKFGAPLI